MLIARAPGRLGTVSTPAGPVF